MVFTIFGFISVGKIKIPPASMKSLADCENLFSNSLQKACSDFLEAACDSQNSSESRL
jgi:hypothetical protein